MIFKYVVEIIEQLNNFFLYVIAIQLSFRDIYKKNYYWYRIIIIKIYYMYAARSCISM